MDEGTPGTHAYPLQATIAARRPATAIRAAEQAARERALTDHGLTWEIAAAVLSHVTEHQHALVPAATHTPILDRLLADDSDAALRAEGDHPHYLAALDLAASDKGLTALNGLVYGWSILVYDHDNEAQVEECRVEGSWDDAETVAEQLLDEHDILTGRADILTCTGTGSSVYR